MLHLLLLFFFSPFHLKKTQLLLKAVTCSKRVSRCTSSLPLRSLLCGEQLSIPARQHPGAPSQARWRVPAATQLPACSTVPVPGARSRGAGRRSREPGAGHAGDPRGPPRSRPSSPDAEQGHPVKSVSNPLVDSVIGFFGGERFSDGLIIQRLFSLLNSCSSRRESWSIFRAGRGSLAMQRGRVTGFIVITLLS